MFERSRILVTAVILGSTSSPIVSAAFPLSAMVEPLPTDAIPTRLVVPTDPEGYIDPVCSQCRIKTTKSPPQTTGSDTATVALDFYDDGLPFLGSIQVTVLLPGEDRRVVWTEPVALDDGEHWEHELASEPDWSWGEVELVWVELTTP